MLLISWLIFPAIFLALALGIGLLVRRLSGKDVEPLLVVPIGLLGIIVVATAGTWFSATAAVTTPVLIALALAGVVLGRHELVAGARQWRRALGPGLAMAAGFLVFGASVFLSGHPTFTGYTQIVDIGHQFDIASYLSQHGRSIPPSDSSAMEVVRKSFVVGYPSGSQAPLGVLSRFFSLELAWIYQPYVAVFAAALIAPLFVLLRDLVPHRGLRLVAAFAAAQPSLLISYAQMGGVKEMTASLAILVAAALLATVPGAAPRTRPSLGIAVAISAGFAVLSLAVVPWLGMILLAAFVVSWKSLGGLKPALATWIPQWLLMILLSAPTLAAATKSGPATTVTQSEELGNLAEPVDRLATAGVWITADHRLPLTDHRTLTMIGVVLVLGLAVLGAVAVLRRRNVGLGILAIAGAVAFPVMVWRFGPWVEFKAMAITGPIVLALAMAGAGSLMTRKVLAPAAFAAVGAITALALFTNALRYNEAALAPYDRLHELELIGKKFSSADRTLYPDFEEQAEYFLRRGKGVAPVNPAAGVFTVRPEVAEARGPGIVFSWDLDELDPAFVEEFDVIVLRRSGRRSRPPANYAHVYSGRFHDVWQRTDDPAPAERATLSSTGAPQDATVCRRFVRQQLRAGRDVTVAPAPRTIEVDPTTGSITGEWAAPAPPGLVTRGTGRAIAEFDVPRAGTYDVVLGIGSVRETRVQIDDTVVGTVGDALSYPGGAKPVGRIHLDAGEHTLNLVRPGGSLAPGNGDGTGRGLGPLWLIESADRQPSLDPVEPGESVARACSGPLDWVEAR